jgi:holo-[acyl-carrier protein] synthase
VSGVGIDLLEIERLDRALTRHPRLAQRLFTPSELSYAESRPRPLQHLAARFCAKEAVAKALRLDAWSWQDVEVDSSGRVALHGTVADRAKGAGAVDVSLTHGRSVAAAVAIVG